MSVQLSRAFVEMVAASTKSGATLVTACRDILQIPIKPDAEVSRQLINSGQHCDISISISITKVTLVA